MLTYLRVKNLALVEELSLEPGKSCNVITGETGAGKSVLMGALGLALGLRGEKGLIRTGADQAVVEAVFDINHVAAPIKNFLDEKGIEPCEDGFLRIKRTLSLAGANRQFVNGTPVSVAILATLGDWLVDIHGPHDHQSLLYPAHQLEILDAFGKTLPEEKAKRSVSETYPTVLKAYTESYERLRSLETKKKELVVDERTYRQQLDMLRYQVKEIESAELNAEEDASLEENYTRAEHSVDILHAVQAGSGMLSEEENSILTQSNVLGRLLQEAIKLDPAGTQEIKDQLDALNSLLYELQRTLSDYGDKVEVDPEALQQMMDRLNVIGNLKRKYGRTIEDILQFGAKAHNHLQQLENRDVELKEIQSSILQEQAHFIQLGQVLSAKRRACIPIIEKIVSTHLKELGFKQSHFNVELQSLSPQTLETETVIPAGVMPTGLDRVEFLFAPNPGEPSHPLRMIASSGEMARVMLALKTALAEADAVPVLVFDEVDANVGGETGLAVGRKMRQIGQKRQVFCITHLAPVAASAHTHFHVEKTVKQGKTHISVRALEGADRVAELARMLGGQMDTARKYAETLLETCSKTATGKKS